MCMCSARLLSMASRHFALSPRPISAARAMPRDLAVRPKVFPPMVAFLRRVLDTCQPVDDGGDMTWGMGYLRKRSSGSAVRVCAI